LRENVPVTTRHARATPARRLPNSAVLLALLAIADTAFAHEQQGVPGGLASGFLHPLTGLDHLAAMVAVGLWGAQLGAPAIWILPITFPLVMAVGGVLGVLGIALPMPEVVIALSALVLGGAVAARLRLPFAIAAIVVGVFAIFHGHAHGAQLPQSANPLAYGVGFVVATGLLHLFGITIGTLSRSPAGGRLIQALGASIAALGCYFLVRNLGGAP
jgi:urease accessory protein